MKAKYTFNGVVKYQTISELELEAKILCEDEDFLLVYLRDCFIADESGFEGNFDDWLNEMYSNNSIEEVY